MRISEFYKLGRSQGSLDFVDVTLETDVPVFVSPRALRELDNEWAQSCLSKIQSFFENIMKLIQLGQNDKAHSLLASLREPNETRLGLSVDKPAGRAMGSGSAKDVWLSLSRSQAAKTGLIRDLEETALFVRGIGRDKISDITTNIIRHELVLYTIEMSNYYGIPLVDGVVSGPIWNALTKSWSSQFVRMPVPKGFGKLILVPKSIVRLGIAYDSSEYYRHYLMEDMKEDEIKRSSSLVETIKDKRGKTIRKRVTKKALKEEYGDGKPAAEEQTLKFPSALERYRAQKEKETSFPLSHEQLAIAEGGKQIDWDQLYKNITNISVGNESSTAYENAIEALLTALFYPALTQPTKQDKVHDGRKRIDITYSNMGVGGFFKWLQGNYSSAKVMIECKNYGKEIANPELDQICGRFSPSRGQFGLIVCRSLENPTLMDNRCRDASRDCRGFVVVLTDMDLLQLTKERKELNNDLSFPLLYERFNRLIM